MSDKFKGHTPGPWRVVEYGNGGHEVFAGATRVNCRAWDTFSLPDAELIAAAPELLAENERLKQESSDLFNTGARLLTENGQLRKENERLHARINLLGDELDGLGFKCVDAENENERLRAENEQQHDALALIESGALLVQRRAVELETETERLRARVAELEQSAYLAAQLNGAHP